MTAAEDRAPTEDRPAADRPPAESESRLVALDEVRAAARRLRGVARRTPLLERELPDGDPVWLKCESLQHGGAFKLRGAYNFTGLLTDEERDAGLVTFSSGNHAQGVAYAARAFGTRAVIVMPEDAPAVKVRGTRALGGEVVVAGTTTTERERRAREIAGETGATLVPPFDHRNIIAGQGTVALEILEQLRKADRPDDAADEAVAETVGRGAAPGLVLVPIGGGGLISGNAVVLRALAPRCRIVGVEPEGAASMRRSVEAGAPVSLEHVKTIADGLKPVRPGDLTFHHCRELVDEVVTVTEGALGEAVLWCFDRRLVVEPSGAATLAALLSGRVRAPSEEDGGTVAVLSGGNIDPGLLAGWLRGVADADVAGGREDEEKRGEARGA